jgi:endogenous inhibitor of DNA gyrase (YacG/DUF329 family)
MKLDLTMKNACPYCGKTAIPFYKKMIAGPSSDINCMNCGKRVGVNSAAIYMGFLFLFIFALVLRSGVSYMTQVISFVVLAFVYGGVLNFFFPMIKKDIY